jgi:hypothetical protein
MEYRAETHWAHFSPSSRHKINSLKISLLYLTNLAYPAHSAPFHRPMASLFLSPSVTKRQRKAMHGVLGSYPILSPVHSLILQN